MAEQGEWTPEALEDLATQGLAITPHRDPAYGWGYTWQGRDWTGPFTTPEAAIHAAFTEAIHALQFRSEYSWVLVARPGECWQFTGNTFGWKQIEEPQSLPSQALDALDAEKQE